MLSKGTNRWQTLLQLVGLSPQLNLQFTVIILFCVMLPLVVLAELQFSYFRQSQKDYSLSGLISGVNTVEGYLFEHKGLLRNMTALAGAALPTAQDAKPQAMRLLTQSLISSRSSFAVVIDGQGHLAYGIAQVLKDSSLPQQLAHPSIRLAGLGYLDDFAQMLRQKNGNPTEALSATRYALVPVRQNCSLRELAGVNASARHINFLRLSKRTIDCLGLSSQLLADENRSLPALALVAVEPISNSKAGQTVYILQGLLLNHLNALPEFFTEHFDAG